MCAIVDTETCHARGLDALRLLRAFLSGGARFVQLRAKDLASGAFLDLARTAASLAHAANATLIINDRADLARLVGADGVHVGQDDLSPRDVRRIVGDAAIVGLSTHTTEQLERAIDEPVSYVAIGPIFTTATKATGYDAVGLAMVRAASSIAARRSLPLVAIGGITIETATSIIDAGGASVAVIGDLLAGGNPEARTREYIRTLA